MPEDAVGVQRMREAPLAVTPPAAPTQLDEQSGLGAGAAVASEQGVRETPGGLLGTGLLAATALAALAFERRRRIGAGPSPRTSRSSCVARPPRRARPSSIVRCAT